MSKVIFVADLFVENYSGGAELTTEALIEKSFLPTTKILSSQLTKNQIDLNKNCFWIFGNFSGIRDDLLLYIAKNLNYSVAEYDYKFCKHRSLELHREVEGEACDCATSRHGKIVSLFLSQAKIIWWMSEAQRQIYFEQFSYLERTKNFVLSSVFNDEALQYFENAIPVKNNEYLVQGSNSWIKGKQDSIDRAKRDKLSYEVVEGLSYKEMLDKLSTSRGLVFLPKGGDTCPRIVIEAKLLGCELVINKNVQHQDEGWFADRETILSYLKKQKAFFWEETARSYLEDIVEDIEKNAKNWSFAAPSYNEGERLRRFLRSCSRIRKFGLDDIFIVNHRSDDHTESILEEMKPVLKNCGIDLRWEYESRDFSKDFTMADLRMKTVNGCKNEIVHIVDSDNIIGKNFIFLVKSAFESFKQAGVYAVGYERIAIDDFAEFDEEGKITNHGPVLPHVSIPRWVKKNNVFCKQNHCDGRYYWFYPKNIERPQWVTVPFGRGKSTILSINDKGEVWKNLRRTMNDFFVLAARGQAKKPWLQSYEAGLLQKTDISKQDYLHEDNILDISLIGDEYFI